MLHPIIKAEDQSRSAAEYVLRSQLDDTYEAGCMLDSDQIHRSKCRINPEGSYHDLIQKIRDCEYQTCERKRPVQSRAQ